MVIQYFLSLKALSWEKSFWAGRLKVSKNDAIVRSIEKILGWLGLAKVQMIALPKIKMRTADLQRVFENHVFGLKLWLGVVGHACILALWRQRRGLENLRPAWRL